MEVTPSVRSTRFTQLDPGDLFIGHHETGSYVALAVSDPHNLGDPNAKDKIVLLLGPASTSFPKVPVLINFPGRAPVVSFAKDYKLRLPSDREMWLDTEPRDEYHCVVLAEDVLYMKALLQTGLRAIPVYIGVQDGRLLTDASGQSTNPSGDCAYTLDWDFLTGEEDAQEILSSRMLYGRK